MINRVAESSRQRIIETLQLLASKDEQLEYRRRVPIADVSAELVCCWDDVFWPDDKNLRTEFSEWSALLRFHSVFERVCRVLPHHPLPPIEQFIESPHWLLLSRAAARALNAISNDDNAT